MKKDEVQVGKVYAAKATDKVVPVRIDAGHVQVDRGDAHVGVAGRVTDLGQGAAAGQGVADGGVAAVVDRERGEAVPSQHLAGGAESFAERVA
jgi:hypothetical protein